MLSELHLKYHSETGNSKPTRQIYDGDDEEFVNIPSEDYLEWLESLAMKQIKKEEPLYNEIKKLREQVKYAAKKLTEHGLL